jgi:hypothetical protein
MSTDPIRLVNDPRKETYEMDEWLLACRTLDAAGVRYLVLGAFGAELHFLHSARQILTQDMDVLVPRDPDNLLRGLLALKQAGFVLQAGG